MMMDYPRWLELMRDQNARLTELEILEGWHFCKEWDGLLIHPSDDEYDACLCRSSPEKRDEEITA